MLLCSLEIQTIRYINLGVVRNADSGRPLSQPITQQAAAAAPQQQQQQQPQQQTHAAYATALDPRYKKR
jgi:hypothetical protein